MKDFIATLDTAYAAVQSDEAALEAAKAALEKAKERLSASKAGLDLAFETGEKLGLPKAKQRKAAEDRYLAAAALGLFEAAPAATTSTALKPTKPRKAAERLDPLVAAAKAAGDAAAVTTAPSAEAPAGVIADANSPAEGADEERVDESSDEGLAPEIETAEAEADARAEAAGAAETAGANDEHAEDDIYGHDPVDAGAAGDDDPVPELAPEPAPAPAPSPVKFAAPGFLKK